MPKNPLFKPASWLPDPVKHCITDATRTARAVGISIQLHVETDLWRWHFIPNDC